MNQIFRDVIYLNNIGDSSSAGDIITLIKNSEVEKVRTFLTDKPEVLQMKDQLQGAALLHFATQYNKVDIIQLLIELKSDINVTDDDGILSYILYYYSGRIIFMRMYLLMA